MQTTEANYIDDMYKFRSCFRQLYMIDTRLEGDIVNDLSDLYKDNVKGIDIKLTEFQVTIELKDDVVSSELIYEFYRIQTRVREIVSKFLLTNIDAMNLDMQTKLRMINYIKNNQLLFDSYLISNCVKIIL